MKKQLLILTILLTLTNWCRALDYSYSTNGFWALNYYTNIYMGVNISDGATNGDSWESAVWKINAAMNLTQRRWEAQMATNAWLFTNATTGSGGLTNIVFTNNYGASVVQVFNNGRVAGYSISNSITVTNFVTNTITSYVFSNAIYSSKQILTYATNTAYWAASNYLGRVSGLVDWTLVPGNDGDNPPMNIDMTLKGSYNGTNGWFTLTNGFVTSNTITLVALTNGLSQRGKPIAMPGSARLYTLDHWELYHVTNWLDYQYLRRSAPVTDPNDVVTKSYADNLYFAAFDNNWHRTTDAGGTNHYSLTLNGNLGADFTWTIVYAQVKDSYGSGLLEYSPGVFGPTNFVIELYNTNLTAGWTIQSGTDLALPFTNWTTFTTNISGGVTTITIPMNQSEPARFFAVLNSSSLGARIVLPLVLDNGNIWPSNTWNLAVITNRLALLGPGKHYTTVSSNGLALVTLSYSNGVVRYVRSDW